VLSANIGLKGAKGITVKYVEDTNGVSLASTNIPTRVYTNGVSLAYTVVTPYIYFLCIPIHPWAAGSTREALIFKNELLSSL
jgi:hypothetical protein